MPGRSKVRIGLSMRVEIAKGYAEPRDALAQDWHHFMAAALPDADWIPIVNLGNEVATYCRSWGVNRLILTGGNDIGDNALRDETELALLELAADANMPVLGICRGMQIMAHRQGVPMEAVQGHAGSRHPLVGEYSHNVNSYHRLRLFNCPEGFGVLARAGDGTIEAIRHKSLPWEGWMWHPEREATSNERDVQRIQRLFQ